MTTSPKSDSNPDAPCAMCDTAGTQSSADRAVGTIPTTGWLEAGTTLGDWKIERLIGLGGMGTVYEAVHVLIGKRAAIKVVRADMTAQTGERFVREAWVVNQIEHRHIVDIFHIGRLDDGRPYLVMELLQGKNLDERMSEGRVRPDETIDILLQMCSALAAAHAHGVVHRDLKPANIVLADDPANPGTTIVKLVDWGIAKLVDQLKEPTSQTLSGTLLGTPEHMSPEQARGQDDVDGRSDIYALGSIAYEMFLESPPFVADNVAELLAMHLREAPPPPSDVWPDIPRALERLLCQMLAKAPADRPTLETIVATLATVREELANRRLARGARGARSVSVSASLQALLPRRRSMRSLALVGVLAVATATLVLGRSATAPGAWQADAHAEAPADHAVGAPVASMDLAPADLGAAVTAVVQTISGEPATSPAVDAQTGDSPRPRAKRTSARRRSPPKVDPNGTIDPFL